MNPPSGNALPVPTCHLCGSDQLEQDAPFAGYRRVTSDCKPWPAGGILARCCDCGLVQAGVTPTWREEAQTIYAQYTIYAQSGGAEQPVFKGAEGQPQRRSEAIIDALCAHESLSPQGRLLDIGCGNGAFLTAFGKRMPQWTLHGLEVDDKHRKQVEALPGVAALHTGTLAELPGPFEMISGIHVLEHIPSPMTFLTDLGSKLSPGGLLLMEVPNCLSNPFMLLIADHCSHFSPGMLAQLVAASGLEVRHATPDWIPREVTVVARKISPGSPARLVRMPSAESLQVYRGREVLDAIIRQATPHSSKHPFGIFGTSIAATWLDAQLGRPATFFVDEDPHRVGSQHLGRPVLAPSDIPPRGVVYLALPHHIAVQVAARMRRPDLEIAYPEP